MPIDTGIFRPITTYTPDLIGSYMAGKQRRRDEEMDDWKLSRLKTEAERADTEWGWRLADRPEEQKRSAMRFEGELADINKKKTETAEYNSPEAIKARQSKLLLEDKATELQGKITDNNNLLESIRFVRSAANPVQAYTQKLDEWIRSHPGSGDQLNDLRLDPNTATPKMVYAVLDELSGAAEEQRKEIAAQARELDLHRKKAVIDTDEAIRQRRGEGLADIDKYEEMTRLGIPIPGAARGGQGAVKPPSVSEMSRIRNNAYNEWFGMTHDTEGNPIPGSEPFEEFFPRYLNQLGVGGGGQESTGPQTASELNATVRRGKADGGQYTDEEIEALVLQLPEDQQLAYHEGRGGHARTQTTPSRFAPLGEIPSGMEGGGGQTRTDTDGNGQARTEVVDSRIETVDGRKLERLIRSGTEIKNITKTPEWNRISDGEQRVLLSIYREMVDAAFWGPITRTGKRLGRELNRWGTAQQGTGGVSFGAR